MRRTSEKLEEIRAEVARLKKNVEELRRLKSDCEHIRKLRGILVRTECD